MVTKAVALLLLFTVQLLAPASAGTCPKLAPWAARHGLTSTQYQADFNAKVRAGYRLVVTSGYGVGNKLYFASLWDKPLVPDKTAWVAYHILTPAQYQNNFNIWTKKGYCPKFVNGYNVGNSVYYSAMWAKKDCAPYVAAHGMSAAAYQAKFNAMTLKGYVISYVSGHSDKGNARYNAIWEKRIAPRTAAVHGLTSAQYQARFDYYKALGYRLKLVNGYALGSNVFSGLNVRYVAIWEKKASVGYGGVHGIALGSEYQCVFDNYKYQGYRPRHVSGYASGGGLFSSPVDTYAAVFELQPGRLSHSNLVGIESKVKAFLTKYDIPGASIAYSRNNRLVLASGYGLSDKGNGKRACPTNTWRIASLSKAITSAAIYKLIEQKKLKSINQKVFGPGSIFGNTYRPPNGWQPYHLQITLKHLLEHTAGGKQWDNTGSDGSDPMFEGSTINYSHAQLIRWVLANRVIDRPPGTVYRYSNFGYSVLGRVIEKVTKQGYGTWTKANVLFGLDMWIGGDKKNQKRANEVVYDSGSAYGMKVTRMDSHGGWIASAKDLVKFIDRVDLQKPVPDILTPKSIKDMTTSSLGNGYAKGWGVSASAWSHNGALPGTATIMQHNVKDGWNWVILTNGRSGDDGFFGALGQLGKSIKASIIQLPCDTYNLYATSK